MDHSKLTPSKKLNCESIVMLSPITPAQNDSKFKIFHGSTNSHSLLPNHSTPPSGLANFIARNPFEADLTSRLHISVMSPTVFSKVLSFVLIINNIIFFFMFCSISMNVLKLQLIKLVCRFPVQFKKVLLDSHGV